MQTVGIVNFIIVRKVVVAVHPGALGCSCLTRRGAVGVAVKGWKAWLVGINKTTQRSDVSGVSLAGPEGE